MSIGPKYTFTSRHLDHLDLLKIQSTKEIEDEGGRMFRGSGVRSASISPIALKDGAIQTNVFILYANTGGFIVTVEIKHANRLFPEETDNQKGFFFF